MRLLSFKETAAELNSLGEDFSKIRTGTINTGDGMFELVLINIRILTNVVNPSSVRGVSSGFSFSMAELLESNAAIRVQISVNHHASVHSYIILRKGDNLKMLFIDCVRSLVGMHSHQLESGLQSIQDSVRLLEFPASSSSGGP